VQQWPYLSSAGEEDKGGLPYITVGAVLQPRPFRDFKAIAFSWQNR
jgi:hypothetical protein